jgi:hypothetical protein
MNLIDWKPRSIVFLDKIFDKTFRTSVTVRIFDVQMDHEEHILPHVVFVGDVNQESALRIPIERVSINGANKTLICHIALSIGFELSELAKRIDDDTKDDVEQNGDNNGEIRELE